jgi:hypothetical protein
MGSKITRMGEGKGMKSFASKSGRQDVQELLEN